jgi:hypothetical protein
MCGVRSAALDGSVAPLCPRARLGRWVVGLAVGAKLPVDGVGQVLRDPEGNEFCLH